MATLQSSLGVITFDPATGFVTAVQGFEPYTETEAGVEVRHEPVIPYKIDIDEWRIHYGCALEDTDYDILDFGYWYWKSKGRAGYEEPAHDWRADRELARADAL